MADEDFDQAWGEKRCFLFGHGTCNHRARPEKELLGGQRLCKNHSKKYTLLKNGTQKEAGAELWVAEVKAALLGGDDDDHNPRPRPRPSRPPPRHPASHNQVVDAIRRAQLYSTQETVGARVSGANIGEAFDIWIKCDSDAVFPAGMFVGSRLHGDNVDLRAGQTGSIPGEIKYAKGAETLCQGVYLSTRVRQSWTAPPQQDESEDVRSLGQLRSMVPSEIDLMLSGAVYQILIVVPAVELQSDVRWPVYITASAAQRTNLARQFAPPGPHPVPRLVKGKHGGSHWALALSRTFENTASLYTPIAYLV